MSVVLCTFSISISASYRPKHEKKIYSMFDPLRSLLLIPTDHGTVQFPLASTPSIQVCVQRLELVVIKPTTAYMQLQPQKCSDMVLLKSSFKSGQDIVCCKDYAHMKGWMKCSIKQQHQAAASLLSNIPGKTHSMIYTQHLMSTKTQSISMPPISLAPQITLHDLQSCTINVCHQQQHHHNIQYNLSHKITILQ